MTVSHRCSCSVQGLLAWRAPSWDRRVHAETRRRNEFANLGDIILRNKNHVARLQMNILGQSLVVQHLLYVDDLRLCPILRYPAEKEHLRVLRFFGESSRLRESLHQSHVSAHLVLARMPNHSSGCEKWLFEILQLHRNDRIVQEFGVSRLHRFPEFRNGLPGHVKIT